MMQSVVGMEMNFIRVVANEAGRRCRAPLSMTPQYRSVLGCSLSLSVGLTSKIQNRQNARRLFEDVRVLTEIRSFQVVSFLCINDSSSFASNNDNDATTPQQEERQLSHRHHHHHGGGGGRRRYSVCVERERVSWMGTVQSRNDCTRVVMLPFCVVDTTLACVPIFFL